MENDKIARPAQRREGDGWPPATRRLLTRREVSADGRAVFGTGDPAWEGFYRDRWAHDKVVRSTHGVNCTGSCSWMVYVKDGIIGKSSGTRRGCCWPPGTE
jgi:nitrate reductase alpha subunit